jgi:DNA (cytosine-5)-methyltransferase 1
MSVANHKKNPNEIKKNSLVLESIYLVRDIKPKIFLFENVPSFLKTEIGLNGGGCSEDFNPCR